MFVNRLIYLGIFTVCTLLLIDQALAAQTDWKKDWEQTIAAAKSAGCLTCHQGARDPHFKDTVRLGCTDCHGG